METLEEENANLKNKLKAKETAHKINVQKSKDNIENVSKRFQKIEDQLLAKDSTIKSMKRTFDKRIEKEKHTSTEIIDAKNLEIQKLKQKLQRTRDFFMSQEKKENEKEQTLVKSNAKGDNPQLQLKVPVVAQIETDSFDDNNLTMSKNKLKKQKKKAFKKLKKTFEQQQKVTADRCLQNSTGEKGN